MDFTEVDAGVTGSDIYDDVNSGHWWMETALKIKQEHPDLVQSSVLWPIILIINGVSHSEFTDLKQEPVLMKLFSAFKRNVQNKPQAWTPLAYIDYKGNLKGKVSTFIAPLNEYHEVLGMVLLSVLAEVQPTGMNWIFTLPNEEKKEVVIFFPLQFIIGNCEGHDKICGQHISHNNTPGLVRDCYIRTDMADVPFHVCHFYTSEEMSAFTNNELKERSFHRIQVPCTRRIDFGGSIQGVHGAAMPEKHHVFLIASFKEDGDLYPNSLSINSQVHTDNVM